MRGPIIAGTIILGLSAISFALARAGEGKVADAVASASRRPAEAAEKARPDSEAIRDQVARLRAEVELLQLDHDLARDRLSVALKESAGSIEDSPAGQLARDYMRIGAEVVGKGPEFDSAMREKGDAIWKAVNKATAAPPSAEVARLRREFLDAATALNRKKIELVGREIHLEGSM